MHFLNNPRSILNSLFSLKSKTVFSTRKETLGLSIYHKDSKSLDRYAVFASQNVLEKLT